MKQTLLFLSLLMFSVSTFAQNKVLRDFGYKIGILRTGKNNAITDVKGIKVGHFTKTEGENIRTGVTAILPHEGNIFQDKVPAAIYIGNGFGKLTGYSQVKELGNLETPVLLTNTLSVPTAADALIDYTLSQPENEQLRSINPVVGETNDGWLNDIQGRVLSKTDMLAAIKAADTGSVSQGNVGAGTGTVCFGFKGGIGTSSRKLPKKRGGYTVGVLVQSNFGGILQVAGVPVGQELGQYAYSSTAREYDADGSCMIVVATDAPLTSRNLERLAFRALLGLGRTGGIASHGSGDYVIAFSTATSVRIPYQSDAALQTYTELRDEQVSILFEAVIEATEEAIINSIFAAETMTGKDKRTVEALPIQKTLEIMNRYQGKK
jgi:D-aminopeptidase